MVCVLIKRPNTPTTRNRTQAQAVIINEKEISKKYLEFTEAGIPAEDARAVLPNAASTSIVASLNLREMIHLANLRLCTRAQYEIRSMVKMMCDELIKEEPVNENVGHELLEFINYWTESELEE